jgi:hypothetical protein
MRIVRVLVMGGCMMTAIRGHAAALPSRHAGTRLLSSHDGRLVAEVIDPAALPPEFKHRDRFTAAAFVTQVELDGTPFVYAGINHKPQDFLGGLPMEFDLCERTLPPGYAEAGVGEPFLKIGVGILRKDDTTYRFSKDYPDIERAETRVAWRPDGATFRQELTGSAQGYAYALDVDLALEDNRLLHTIRLVNTGTKPFTTEPYVHNFLRFGNRDLGPEYRLTFPHAITLCDNQNRPATNTAPVFVQDGARVLTFADPAAGTAMGGKIFVVAPADYAGSSRFTVEHTDTGRRLTIEASRPAHNVAVWTTAFQLSPEVNIQLRLEPGEDAVLTRTYTFETVGDGTRAPLPAGDAE